MRERHPEADVASARILGGRRVSLYPHYLPEKNRAIGMLPPKLS
jgi:hypothetical protein